MGHGNLDRPPYEIRDIDTGEDDLELGIRVNGYRFAISISPDTFSNSPVAQSTFQRTFDKIIAGEDDDPEVWDYCEQIANVFLPDFKRLAPPAVHSGKLTMADLAVRGAFECELRVVDETPLAVSVTERVPDDEYYEEWDVRKIQSAFPVFTPAEVEVPYTDGSHIYDIIPQRVLVHGQPFFHKTSWSPCDPIEEIRKYAKIKTSNLSTDDFHISRLSGIVAHPNGYTKGLLYELIETSSDGTLRSIIKPGIPLSTRQKWANQVRSTVAYLHKLDLVWGDVKPDNVLIDKNDNAVIIDLEGGTTRGWVDYELGGTLQGDLQGLEKLMDFILNEESPLRLESDSDTEYSEEVMDED
ncbi:kinase domain-containing [Fusarium albosuccineum]|uniref:Kinase domain-containing n=1 Tax=Fusarium albosuccineum TaxID=1237068 RepID=A0A8H4L868_9HYPO|nr:kinase domain-containing [Fusarium albosuccineum]